MNIEQITEIAAALAEPARLRILALLARRPHYAEELAEATQLHPATISHHLRRLRSAGLVEIERRSPYRLIQRQPASWSEWLEELAQIDDWAERLELPGEERISGRLLQRYLDADGKVAKWPRQARPLDIVLRHVSQDLAPDRLYPRRELLHRLLERCTDGERCLELLEARGWLLASGSVYRRVTKGDEP